MSDTVVDSSVAAKWILPEVDSTRAQRLVSDVAGVGERLIVLDLAFAEIVNAIWKQVHRNVATLAEARQFLDSHADCCFAEWRDSATGTIATQLAGGAATTGGSCRGS